ncbi:MAG TPA: HAMP domain-containing sensor histidine kinase [Candidatus Kapabacteria bacterium]|nr:HAMP domain-containing histidine kinase [Candidatus Kapabacteria bacterium]HOV91704.1 HAMP domain-containing sensor histidine kinase [Candidatus Kapabacteria bacterium]
MKQFSFINFNHLFHPNISPFSKWYIKVALIVLSFIFVITSIIYTDSLVQEIIEREKGLLDFYTDIYQHYSDPTANIEDFSFFLEKITPQINFPIIITDSNDVPLEDFDIYSANINIDKNLSYPDKRKAYQDMVWKMKAKYDPIIIVDSTGKVLQKFYYFHSPLVDKFRLFPVISFIIILIFVGIGYIAFSASRRNEESMVWIGMAKEAAHQLGTPLSSLLAWLEILKNRSTDPEILEIINEMEIDVDRLNIVATRFSKIGSKAELKPTNITELIEDVSKYFEKRLPHLGNKVTIKRDISKNYYVDLNSDLFSWVFENLFKNAADAIEQNEGLIEVSIKERPGNRIRILVKDNGRGMTNKVKRNIFIPGFSTKKRGWGLGLSLAKKIVEDYHNSKIYVKETAPGKGTTFAIDMKLSPKYEKLLSD